ncbi:hypothetical protein GCM10007424_25830 [Flavobacterium suaedae]|uniref:Lipoprotein n=1 Tax=Flavobacterium suaedae TaxID=1767027 RepID=A0ABQ1K656_9FLAO|nr:hypothetical protein [Flavobacterium suaedae]GGB84618.1 hypothetical protein GCM10007424_25830 [Flavobacterium suaedae]
MKKTILILVMLFLLVSCARHTSCDFPTEEQYGFWSGLLHGIISPIGLVGMLIYDDVAVFAPNNNGAWYAFGFLLGSGGWGFLASRGSKK